MSALHAHVADYLRLRRALGFKLERPGYDLPQFVSWLEANKIETITVDAAIAWARLPEHAQPIYKSQRLGAVRGFARYLHTIDPATEIPPGGLFGKQQRHPPYIYTDEEIGRLLQAAGQLPHPLRAATHETLLGLLASTGMRVGEAVGLARRDVNLADGLVTVRHGKFDRDRLVPLHASASHVLRGYAAQRDQLYPTPATDAFFVSSAGTALHQASVNAVFPRLLAAAGLPTGARHPRVHDLRHSFAVRTLIDWQRDGIDITTRLPALSAYLGHVNPASTYWYLTGIAELMQLAAARLDNGRCVAATGTRR